MSYADCIKKAGLTNEEIRIYDAAIEKHQAEGMTPEEAQKAAANTRLTELDQDKTNLLAKIQEAEKRAIPDDVERDRRKAPKARELYEEMSREELISQILKHELTGIKGRKAFVIDVQDAPFIGSIDADSLKWINDNLSPDHGDALLQAVADAIESQTDSAYHISGDEFYVLGETQAEIEAILKKTDEILSKAVITATKPDGKVITMNGLNITYGIGDSKDVADQKLKAEKIAREAKGERAGRGEQPPGAVIRDAEGNEIVGYTPDVTYEQRDLEKDLVNVHNLSAEGILAADELGGLAAPSIATIRAGISDFTGFGEVSLIADPEFLLDPKARTFDADIYSPRQPRAVYDINSDMYFAFERQLDPDNLGLSKPDINSMEDTTGPDNFQRSTSVEYYFLQSQGKAPKLKKAKVDPVIRKFSKTDKHQFDLFEDEKFIKAVTDHYQKKIDDLAADGFDVRAEKMVDWYFNEDGAIQQSKLRDMASEVNRYRQTGGYDVHQLRDDITKKMRVNKTRAEYDQWATEKFNSMVKGKKLFKGFTPSGNRRYVDYNLQNVVKEMTQKLQAGENFFYGAGTVRSKYANEMKTIKQIQAKREEIISEEDMKKVKEESSDVFMGALEKLKPFYKYDADSWGYADDAGNAIIEGKKGLKEAFNMEPEAQKIVDDLIEYLVALPTSYFETKFKRPVQFKEFDTAIVPKGMRADAKDVLKDAGLKIKHYDPKIEGSRSEIIAKQSRLLYQKTRAQIQFTDKNESIIRLTQASDLSSFLHESGHLFLEMEKRFADKFGQTKEQQVLLDWLGVKSFDELTVKEHEKFAETFEVYLREGKAPSIKLRDAFAAFARWLTVIYRKLTDPRLAGAEFTPEIREYMDRMLATEVEIEQAMANPAYDQLFRSKEQAGMTDAQWKAYQKQAQKAKNAATIDLNQKVIDELRKRKTKEWNEEKSPLIDEEVERLSKLPVYRVLNDSIGAPMDRDALKEAGEIQSIPTQLRNRTVKGGQDPEAMAELYGFKSVKGMVQEIMSSKTLKIAAQDAAEARMVEKYGDMLNDGRIELEARESVHNEEQAKLLLQEIRALSRGKPAIDREYLKSEAKALIQTMKYKEIKPNKFYRAEIKAAENAVKAADADKLNYKVQQAANHYLYREAVKVKEQMNKHRKQIRGYETREYNPKAVHPSYAQNIKMLAKSYNMRQGTAGKNLDVERVVSWMVTQMNDPNNYIDLTIIDPAVIKMVVARQDGLPVNYDLPAFDDLTAAELKGVNDQLRHMRYVGGKLSDTAMNEINLNRLNASESIDKYAKKKISPRHERKYGERAKDAFLEFGYSHRRIGGIFETLDGFKEGPMANEYEAITSASNKELELTNSMAKQMDAAFKDVLKSINRRKKASITKEDGVEFTLSHRARFVLGLNWGNTGNREAVLQGLNNKFPDTYTEQDVVSMLSTMSKVELDALNKVWGAKESLWPEMSRVEVNRKGVAPQKVEADPFTINGVELTGGHYRLHYMKDPADSARTEITVDRSANNQIKVGTAGSMNERVGSGGRQVDLELGHLFQDVSEEIHYIAYAELSDHLNTMFKGVNNPVVSSVMRGYGEPYYNNLITTLSALTQPEDGAKGLWKGLKFVRSNLTYAFLAGSVRNVIQQPIAVTNAISQLGEKYVLKGMLEFYRHPVDNWNKISESSAFMQNRTALVNREAREQLLKIDSLHPAIGKMKNIAFAPQTFMDSLIAYPTWMGAMSRYKAEHPGAPESKAMAYADEMVAKTIGSGLSKDVGSILNKGEAEKQITFMGTFFNLTWNLHVENAQLLKNGQINPMEYARRLGWMAIAPALLSIWILDDVPEDEEEMLEHTLKEIAFYNMSSIFLVRDLASKIDGFNPSIPGLKFADGIVRVSSEMKGLMTGDEDFDAETVASIIRGMQPLVPIAGSGQLARTLEGMADQNQDIYGALVEGKERN